MVLSVLGTLVSFIFYFFKQKTAYEMRIRDWSSDVCSSDLPDGIGQTPYGFEVRIRPAGADQGLADPGGAADRTGKADLPKVLAGRGEKQGIRLHLGRPAPRSGRSELRRQRAHAEAADGDRRIAPFPAPGDEDGNLLQLRLAQVERAHRSDEDTYELPSL